MAQSKSRTPLRKPNAVQKPLPAAQDEISDDFHGLGGDDAMEKDEIEVELEKLVFGDDAGFHEDLKSYHAGVFTTEHEANAEDQQDTAQVSDEDQGLEDVDDADVRTLIMLFTPSKKILTQNGASSFSSILHRQRLLIQIWYSHKPPRTMRGTLLTMVKLQPGSIARMSVLSCLWLLILGYVNCDSLSPKT